MVVHPRWRVRRAARGRGGPRAHASGAGEMRPLTRSTPCCLQQGQDACIVSQDRSRRARSTPESRERTQSSYYLHIRSADRGAERAFRGWKRAKRASCRRATPIPMKARPCVRAPLGVLRIFRATQFLPEGQARLCSLSTKRSTSGVRAEGARLAGDPAPGKPEQQPATSTGRPAPRDQWTMAGRRAVQRPDAPTFRRGWKIDEPIDRPERRFVGVSDLAGVSNPFRRGIGRTRVIVRIGPSGAIGEFGGRDWRDRLLGRRKPCDNLI